MENFSPTNNGEYLSANTSPVLPHPQSSDPQMSVFQFGMTNNNQENLSPNMIPAFPNSQNQGSLPPNMIPLLPSSQIPSFDLGTANSNLGHLPPTMPLELPNSQIPLFELGIANSNQRPLPPNMTPALPNPQISLPNFGTSNSSQEHFPKNRSPSLLFPQNQLFNFGNTNFNQEQISPNMPSTLQNTQISVLNFETANSNQEHLPQNMSPSLLNTQNLVYGSTNANSNHQQLDLQSQLIPVFDVGNSSSNHENLPPNISPANTGIPIFNVGMTGSSDGNSCNLAPRSKPRGRPLGSKNKAKVLDVSANKDSWVVLEIPPAQDIIKWLIDYAQSEKVSITIDGGSAFISKVVFSCSDSQPEPHIFSEDNLRMISIFGTYLYSPAGPPSSCTSFKVVVARGDMQVTGGTAHQIVTAETAVLSAICLNNH